MSVVTLRLPEKFLRDIDAHAHIVHMHRAEYIRYALERTNKEIQNKERAERLKKASLRVRKESMRVNKEFSGIEYDPKD